MYVNAKMIPVESVPGIRGGGWGEQWREEIIYLIHSMNL
jgi:hypothetical protein